MRLSLVLLGLLLAACWAGAQGSDPGPVICIDPGHPSEVGLGTRGKRFTELEVAWRVGKLLERKLRADGYQVVLTKRAMKQKVLNRRRAEIANEAGAALMVRLHCDAVGGRGFAVYHPDRQGSSQGRTGPSEEVILASAAAARALHEGMRGSLRGALRDRGVLTDRHTAIGNRQGALTGSIFSEVPVVLVEMLVLTHGGDEAFLAGRNGFERLAEALRRGVRAAVPPGR